MTTLYDLAYRVASELGILTEGKATAGSTTTVADTNDRTEANDYWNGGSVFIVRDAGGAGAAPEGQFGVVSDFANSGGLITLRDALTVVVAAGDKYAIADSTRFTLYKIVQQVNRAVGDLGDVPQTMDSSLTTATAQTEYALPSTAVTRGLRRVLLQTVSTDTNDNRWVEVHGWRIEKTARGTVDTLVFDRQPTSGYKIGLEYVGVHPELHLYSDRLEEHIHPNRIVYRAALALLLDWKHQYRQDTYDFDITRLERMAQEAELRYPVVFTSRPGSILVLDEIGNDYSNEPNRVYL